MSKTSNYTKPRFGYFLITIFLGRVKTQTGSCSRSDPYSDFRLDPDPYNTNTDLKHWLDLLKCYRWSVSLQPRQVCLFKACRAFYFPPVVPLPSSPPSPPSSSLVLREDQHSSNSSYSPPRSCDSIIAVTILENS